MQFCTRLLVVTGFSTHACDPEDLLSSRTGGARGTISDTGTENLLIPETAWGVCAADLSTLGMEMTPLKRSSAEAELGESPPVQMKMPLQLRRLLPPVTGWDHPSCWTELSRSGTYTRYKDDNKLASFKQPSVCECLCNTLLGNVGR